MGRNDRQQRSGIDDVLAVLHEGARAAYGVGADERVLDQTVDALVGAANAGYCDVEPVLSNELVRFVGVLYEGGWQPLDVMHVIRREANSRVTTLLRNVIREQAERSGAAGQAPPEWLEQLAAVAVGPSTGAVRLGLAEGLYEGLQLFGMLINLPRLAPIGPLPSHWSTAPRARATLPRSSADPKLMARIRALLAKAEATTFEAEADAFTSKAQDLMTRHAIDAAVLLSADHHDLRSDVVARRIHLDNPYAAEKVDLLATVGHANGVRTVWNDGLGFATVMGLPLDLDLAELLFTSLLLQATRAVSDASTASARTRSRTFRRAFLVGYAHRIGQRLDEAVQHANSDAATQYGTALVPVLAARTEAVDDEFARMFPSTRTMRGGRFDSHGWAAGMAAADLAVIDSRSTSTLGAATSTEARG